MIKKIPVITEWTKQRYNPSGRGPDETKYFLRINEHLAYELRPIGWTSYAAYALTWPSKEKILVFQVTESKAMKAVKDHFAKYSATHKNPSISIKSKETKLAQIEALIESAKRELNYPLANREAIRERIKKLDARYSEVRNMKLKNSGIFGEDSAEDLAVGFHGRPSQETFEIEERETFRQDLAMLGELEELDVFNEIAWNETGELKTFTFSRKKKDVVRLAGSPDRRQLFLVGGDQEIPDSVLEDLAGDRQASKDKVSLGFVYSISYWSDKHHLEGSNGVMEAYMHCFGESTFENPDARQDGQADYMVFMPEQKLGAGLLPELVYDRLNMTLELVGGGYEIRDEGIWD